MIVKLDTGQAAPFLGRSVRPGGPGPMVAFLGPHPSLPGRRGDPAVQGLWLPVDQAVGSLSCLSDGDKPSRGLLTSSSALLVFEV